LVNPFLAKIGLKIFERAGYQISSTKSLDYSKDDLKIIDFVKPYTLTDHQRLKSLLDGVEYIIKNKLPGSFVECGVWKGGSMMAVAKKLQDLNADDRDIFLFDTFEGMSAPSEHDISQTGFNPLDESKSKHMENPLDLVKANLYKTNYPKSKIHFIKGKVEDTLSKYDTGEIAILRIDTDYYESTKTEMESLFPKIIKGGIIIIDDFGSWLGARKAVLEYIEKNKIQIYLNRIHPLGARIGIKIEN